MIFAEAVPNFLPWLKDLQEYLPEGVPALPVAAGGVLLALALVLTVLRRLWRVFARKRPKTEDWDRELRIALDDCPLPTRAVEGKQLTVYHLPARLRLVVVAGVGRENEVDATAVEKVLDKVLPGLGAVAAQDRPRIRVWPPQISRQGFAAAFHRNTPKAAKRGEPSRWVLVAGGTHGGPHGVLLGLGLWADDPNTLDRLTLEGHQWLDVLRLRDPEF